MKHCRFCGGKVYVDATQCKHCGKSFQANSTETGESRGLTNLDSWQKKSVPSWVMYVVLVAFLFCVAFLIVKGCESKSVTDNQANQIRWHVG